MAFTPTTFVEGAAPGISAAELNKFGTGIDDAHALNVDDVTVVDTSAPTGDTTAPKTLFNWFANMIKQITGKANWRTTPRTTLENAVKLNGDTMTGNLTVNGANIGGSVSTGYYQDTTNLALRIPNSGGAVYLQTPSGAGTFARIGPSAYFELDGVIQPQFRKTNGYVEWNNGGTWLPLGERVAVYGNTVQESFNTTQQNSNLSSYRLVAKHIPKGIGEMKITVELASQGGGSAYLYLYTPTVNSNSTAVSAWRDATGVTGGPTWDLPLGTELTSGNTFYQAVTATTANVTTFLNVSTAIRVHSKEPVYLFINGSGFQVACRNLSISYDLVV